MSKQLLLVLVIVGLLLALGGYWYANQGTPPIPVQDESGWYSSVTEALKQADRTGPRIVVVTRAGWSRYERNNFEHASVANLIEPLVRVRIDPTQDTPRMEAWGVTDVPALVIVNAAGDVITKLDGPRDISVVRRAIQRSIEFPVPFNELAKATDNPSTLRYAEACLDQGLFETAAQTARRFVGPDSSVEAAHGQYLYTYATAEMGNVAEAEKLAKEYLARYPQGEDRAALLWILVVFDLQKDRTAPAVEKIDAIVKADPASPFARQAVVAYAMEYLARGKNKLADAEKFLTAQIEDSSPWTEDYLMARSALRLANPADPGPGLADLKRIATGGGSLAPDAQERLVLLAMGPAGQLLMPQITLMFQDISRSDASGFARFNLARLYVLSEDTTRAREEAQTLAVTGGEYADDALLLLATLSLELDKQPDQAIPILMDIIKKYPNRETSWAARYGLARALFFSGRMEEAELAIKDVLAYVAGRRYLPDEFLIIMPRVMRPQEVQQQFRDFLGKIEALKKEENGAAVFRVLLDGVIASSRGDSSTALAKFNELVANHPASSLADDALFEIAKVQLRGGNMEEAKKALTRITTSYKESDQFEAAEQFLAAFVESQQNPRGR